MGAEEVGFRAPVLAEDRQVNPLRLGRVGAFPRVAQQPRLLVRRESRRLAHEDFGGLQLQRSLDQPVSDVPAGTMSIRTGRP